MGHNHERRQMLLAGLGAVGALAVARQARAATCATPGPLRPTGPTMQDLADKVAYTDQGLAEARRPITSVPGSATATHSITESGVYYATGNMTPTPGTPFIEILVSGVELEIDGWFFIGGSNNTPCIVSAPGTRDIGIFDTTFVQWHGAQCIELSGTTLCCLEDIFFDTCDSGPVGTVCVVGEGSTVYDCNILNCTGSRLVVGPNSDAQEVAVLHGSGGGLYSPGPACFEDNFVFSNSGGPAIRVDNGGTVIGNIVVSSGPVSVGSNLVVAENDISSGTSNGIEADGSNNTIEENSVKLCATGILCPSTMDRTTIDGNTISGCTGTGILLVSGSSQGFVVRNTVAATLGVPSYDIAVGNTYGTVVSTVGGGDLGGSGVQPGAWSNFEY